MSSLVESSESTTTISSSVDCESKNSFTKEELEGIKELRRRLKDLLEDKGNTLAKEYIMEETTMWRYVLAQSRENNPMDASEAMFRSSVTWRKEIELLTRMMNEWRGGKRKGNDEPEKSVVAEKSEKKSTKDIERTRSILK